MKSGFFSISYTRFEVIIVLVQVRALKMYAAAVEAFRQKEIDGENRMKLSLPKTKWCISEFHTPPSPVTGPNSGFWCCVFLTLRKTLISLFFWPM
jgi:hypothetical protein